jgi:hypothetical protein
MRLTFKGACNCDVDKLDRGTTANHSVQRRVCAVFLSAAIAVTSCRKPSAAMVATPWLKSIPMDQTIKSFQKSARSSLIWKKQQESPFARVVCEICNMRDLHDQRLEMCAARGLCWEQCPVTLEHVKGHQDETNDGEPLLWEAQLNHRCDELATDHLSSATTVLPLVLPFLPASKVDLTVQGTTLTHHFPSQLRLFAGLPAYREYLCRHHQWETAVFDLIDWPTFGACSRTLSFLKRLFVVKWTNNPLPFQEQQPRFSQSPSSQCPSSCGASENWRHFVRCSHPARVVIWRECSRTIAKTFDTWNIDPSLHRLILYWLARLSDATPIPALNNLGIEYSMLRTTQEADGNDSIMLGYFAVEWVQLQQRYLLARELPDCRNQAAGGIKAIALQLLEQCHNCWESLNRDSILVTFQINNRSSVFYVGNSACLAKHFPGNHKNK